MLPRRHRAYNQAENVHGSFFNYSWGARIRAGDCGPDRRRLSRRLEDRLRWTPLSRPFLVGNKLILGGSEFEFGRPWHSSRPLSFRRSNRRSGRIPAEPYLPFEYLQCRAKHSGPKAINPRGSGTESPDSVMLPSFLPFWPSWSSSSQPDRGWCPVLQALVQPFLVVEPEVPFKPGSRFAH